MNNEVKSNVLMKGSMYTVVNLMINDKNYLNEMKTVISSFHQHSKVLSNIPIILNLNIDNIDEIFILNIIKDISDIENEINVSMNLIGFRTLEEFNLDKVSTLKYLGKINNNIKSNVVENKEFQKDKEIIKNDVKIIHGNVRSGQQIYSQDGDLIIFGNVNMGSEVISNYSIYVYGKLNGKAIAGISGCEKSMIMASKFEPELISINGDYTVYENINSEFLKKRIVVCKENSENFEFKLI